MRRFLRAARITAVAAAALAAAVLRSGPAAASAPAAFDPALLVPRPASWEACPGRVRIAGSLRLPPGFDPGAREMLAERWAALGIPVPRAGEAPELGVGPGPGGDPEHYRLTVGPGPSIRIEASTPEAEFDAAATLAQLVRPVPGGFTLPCVRIDDRPALRWRIVSDDVSRGPLPTMRYFKERIRGLAGLKINGYSPYMEHVFADAAHPLVAPADPITPAQLRELGAYAARFHVALIPEQQTFAHMHETLRWEEEAPLAELPHGWLISPAVPASYDYLRTLVREVVAAAGRIPFLHLGSDEPIDLGRGRSKELVAQEGIPRVFASHVERLAQVLAPLRVRPMIWDDAIQRDPSILGMIPKSTVIVDFHYGNERSYLPYITRVAGAGFDQMVSPGAQNWNQIYPDIDEATANVGRFVADGKASHVLGMFVTVWHDDGESLYESTWYPLAFAAASAWQSGEVDARVFPAAFAAAFFGSEDPRWARTIDRLREIATGLRIGNDPDPSDYLFWADPFDATIGARVRAGIDLHAIRLASEAILTDLAVTKPPLHRAAAAAIVLAARRYDALGRRFQIGQEAEADYDEARANADGNHDSLVYRDLNLAKYLCWEVRDDLLEIEPLYRAAWNYESRPAGLGAVLGRFHLGEQQAQIDADRLNRAQREDYYRMKRLPPFETVLGRPSP